MLSHVDIEKEKKSERRIRYLFNAAQIDTIKRHQWNITHYALLIFAGIVGMTSLIVENIPEKYLVYLGIGLIILDIYILIFIINMLCIY